MTPAAIQGEGKQTQHTEGGIRIIERLRRGACGEAGLVFQRKRGLFLRAEGTKRRENALFSPTKTRGSIFAVLFSSWPRDLHRPLAGGGRKLQYTRSVQGRKEVHAKDSFWGREHFRCEGKRKNPFGDCCFARALREKEGDWVWFKVLYPLSCGIGVRGDRGDAAKRARPPPWVELRTRSARSSKMRRDGY